MKDSGKTSDKDAAALAMTHVEVGARPPAVPLGSTRGQPGWTIGRLLDWTARYLAQRGSEFPRLDTEVLLAHTLGCRRIDLYTRYDESAPEAARERLRELVRRRIEGCPVAYLVGYKEFFALKLEVGPAVLIPRPESEFVVMECLRLAKNMERPKVVDIGTGSGNIALAVAGRHATAMVTAVDVSTDALAVAERNAYRHSLSDRVRFLSGDLFAPIPTVERFDFVVSNPPYIAQEDMDRLPIGVRDYEPHVALNGGPGGYAVFDRLIRDAGCPLRVGGFVIVEIGAPQEHMARQKLESMGGFELAPTIHDYSGHPRVLTARWQG
jgi:release factor glutamine methyltransferase